MRYGRDEVASSLATLHCVLDGHDGPVFTILRHVSRSGMVRDITPLIMVDGEPRFLTYHVARVLGLPDRISPNAVRVGGVGMDMGFHLVYSLSSALYGDGYRLRQRWL